VQKKTKALAKPLHTSSKPKRRTNVRKESTKPSKNSATLTTLILSTQKQPYALDMESFLIGEIMMDMATNGFESRVVPPTEERTGASASKIPKIRVTSPSIKSNSTSFYATSSVWTTASSDKESKLDIRKKKEGNALAAKGELKVYSRPQSVHSDWSLSDGERKCCAFQYFPYQAACLSRREKYIMASLHDIFTGASNEKDLPFAFARKLTKKGRENAAKRTRKDGWKTLRVLAEKAMTRFDIDSDDVSGEEACRRLRGYLEYCTLLYLEELTGSKFFIKMMVSLRLPGTKSIGQWC
jgi:hypothetical protein